MTIASVFIAGGCIAYIHGVTDSSWVCTIIGVVMLAVGMLIGMYKENELDKRIENLEKKERR